MCRGLGNVAIESSEKTTPLSSIGTNSKLFFFFIVKETKNTPRLHAATKKKKEKKKGAGHIHTREHLIGRKLTKEMKYKISF